MNNKTITGALCGMMTGICWGLSGVFGQFLFQTKGIETTWLVPIRLLTSGIILFTYLFFTNREELLALVRNKRDFIQPLTDFVKSLIFFIMFRTLPHHKLCV